MPSGDPSGPAPAAPTSGPRLRARIRDCVAASPGLLAGELSERLGCNRSTLRHHLRVLEQANAVRLVAFRQRVHVFPSALDPTRQDDLAILHRGRTMEFALEVARAPGQPQVQLLARLRMSRKTVRKYVRLLTEHGMVQQASKPPFAVYYPTRRLLQLVRDRIAAPGAEPQPAAH